MSPEMLVLLAWLAAAAADPTAAQTVGGAPAEATRVAREAEPTEVFVRANRAYEEGSYAEAIVLYRELLERGVGSGHVEYNLGNAYLRNGELGAAIAAYRRSRVSLPRDEDVEANLAFARRSTKDAIDPPEPSPVARTLFFWHWSLSPRELAALALGSNLLLCLALVARLRWRRSEALAWAALALALPLAAAAGSLAVHAFAPARVAVVVPQEIDAHTGPDAATVVRFKLHAGTELELRERRDGWLRIALPDGQQGWIEDRWAEVVG